MYFFFLPLLETLKILQCLRVIIIEVYFLLYLVIDVDDIGISVGCPMQELIYYLFVISHISRMQSMKVPLSGFSLSFSFKFRAMSIHCILFKHINS